MSTSELIINYANLHNGSFCRRELMQELAGGEDGIRIVGQGTFLCPICYPLKQYPPILTKRLRVERHEILSPTITKKGIMIDPDVLMPHLDAHLHDDFLKTLVKTTADGFQVVVADDQIDSSIQTVEYLCPLGCSTHAEISQMKDYSIGRNYSIPVSNQSLIHILDILERTVAETHYIPMTEMSV